MSAQVANPGITEVPQPAYLPLPTVNEDLYVIHYSSDLRANCPASTPTVSAIVAQHVLSGARLTFATFTEAEACGIPPAEFRKRLPELEREMLRSFADYATSRPSAVWVHWRMRDALFGFDVLTQRARFHRAKAHGIPPERRFDLSHHLAGRYGDDFAPHPRLWNAVRRNLGAVPEVLDEAATAAAWQRGEYGPVLWSLTAKVGAIARLFDRVRLGRFLTGAGEASPLPDLRATTDRDASACDQAVFRRRGRRTRIAGAVAPNVVIDPPHTAFDSTRLTERHWAILDELRRLKAFDRGSCATTETIAVAVDGPDGKATSFKTPVAKLRGDGLVDAAEGRGGGIWLTPAGRTAAEGRTGT